MKRLPLSTIQQIKDFLKSTQKEGVKLEIELTKDKYEFIKTTLYWMKYNNLKRGDKHTVLTDFYALRSLPQGFHKEYLESYNHDPENYSELTLTLKGFDEWLFPFGQEDAKKIFISHATEDKIFVGKIKSSLEKLGFIAFLAHEDIPATARWRDKLISELKTSGIFIALRTKNYAGKQYTEQECGFALALNKRRLSLCVRHEIIRNGILFRIPREKFWVFSQTCG